MYKEKEIINFIGIIKGEEINTQTKPKSVSVLCESQDDENKFIKQQSERLSKKYPDCEIEILLTTKTKI